MPIKFCRECNNTLFPREDKIRKQLKFVCRHCGTEEPADDPCVYVNEVHHTPDERAILTSDLANDPTLPRTTLVSCPRCNHREAVYTQGKATEQGMALIFICTNSTCGYNWTDQQR